MNSIGFPGLGIGPFDINTTALSLGSITVTWYGILLTLGIIAGFAFALHEAKRTKVDTEIIYDIVLWGLPASIICARIYYVIFSFDEMKGDILNIFKIWDGGIAIYGAIIGAVLAAFIYCKKKNLNVLRVFDVFAIPLMIGQAVGRWGNFVNAEVYGGVTESLFRMSINGVDVHPLFLYESVWMTIGIFGLLLYRNHKKFYGEVFLLYVAWYGIGRGVLEGFRQSQYILKFGVLPISQAIAFLTATVACALIFYFYKKKKNLCIKDAVDIESSDKKENL